MTIQLIQKLKQPLLSNGPQHWAVQVALKAAAYRKGWRLQFGPQTIHLLRGDRELILAAKELVHVPMMFDAGQSFFETMLPEERNGRQVWDYSRPRECTYRRNGMVMYMPALPEEDAMDVYTRWYRPAPGNVVWDLGAHAGLTSYFLSQMVGPAVRVYAWEPDEFTYQCLLRNIERHGLSNVVPLQKALSGTTGRAAFQMDGTMAAGLCEYVQFSHSPNISMIETVALEDACRQYGVPKYVKMDIEGAELALLDGSPDFLGAHPIEWAIEAHQANGRFTDVDLAPMFRSAGYTVHSTIEQQLRFMWAKRN